MQETTELMSPEGHGFWETVRESLRGSHQDYTSGSIARAIMLLAVPMVLEMVLESVFALTDVFFVGKLGADAVATVGLTESLLTVLYALAMGLSIGVTAMVARRIGEKDVEGARDAAVQGVFVGLLIATVLGIAGVIMAPRLLALMGASPEVIRTGSNFTRVMLGGDVSVLLLFLANAIFRGAGDAAIAMRVLWLANAINIVLGPLLIFGVGPFPRLGVTGAAVATTIGRGTGAIFALSRLVRGNGRISISRKDVRVRPSVMGQLVNLSAAGTFQMIIGMASWIGLVRIISSYGSDALAGYTIGVRLIIFAMLPSWGMSNAAATMVGQALGAKDPERAQKAVWRAVGYNTVFLGVVGLIFLFATAPIIGIFTSDPAVARYATDCLHTVSYGFVLYASGMVFTAAFNGAGDTWTPTVLNLIVFWLFEIPLAYFLAQTLHMGPHGVFLAITLAFSAMAVLSAAWFHRGGWKTQTV